MSHGLLAENVDTSLASLLYSCATDAVFSEVHNQWSSENDVRSWRALSLVAELLVIIVIIIKLTQGLNLQFNKFDPVMSPSFLNFILLLRDASAERGDEIACRLSVCLSICL